MDQQEIRAAPKELPLPAKIRIIDNIGIHKGSLIFDVNADPDKIRTHILNNVNRDNPRFINEATEMLEGLTISFGARPVEQLYMDEIKPVWEKENTTGFNISDYLKKNVDYEPKGAFFYHPGRPYLFINAKDINSDEDLRFIWDHEVGHFTSLLDPELRNSNQFLKALLATSCSLLIGSGVLTMLDFANNMRSIIKSNVKLTRREFLKLGLGGTAMAIACGSVAASPSTFDVREKETKADERAIAHPTDMNTLKSLFVVEERH